MFFSYFSDESILLDLKHLLMEAKQKVPPFLAEYASESEKYLDMGGTVLLEVLFTISVIRGYDVHLLELKCHAFGNVFAHGE